MDYIRHHFELIDSTNHWAKEHLQTFEKDKITLVTADQQTAGRGRFKRSWLSPPNQNIYASFCFFLSPERKDIGNIPQIMALSVAKILHNMEFNPVIKWPNDILLNKKKVAGILAETVSHGQTLGMILGIGLNVNMPMEECQKIDQPATSLLVESNKSFEVELVLKPLKQQFTRDLMLFLKEGFAPFLNEYRNYFQKMSTISLQDGNKKIEGTFSGINADGSLSLKHKDGTIHTYVAGEILSLT